MGTKRVKSNLNS